MSPADEQPPGGTAQTGVLLVDDVQFLQSKARTEQEFFHTFNALQGAGSQLVLTSDRLPRDLEALIRDIRLSASVSTRTTVVLQTFYENRPIAL